MRCRSGFATADGYASVIGIGADRVSRARHPERAVEETPEVAGEVTGEVTGEVERLVLVVESRSGCCVNQRRSER